MFVRSFLRFLIVFEFQKHPIFGGRVPPPGPKYADPTKKMLPAGRYRISAFSGIKNHVKIFFKSKVILV